MEDVMNSLSRFSLVVAVVLSACLPAKAQEAELGVEVAESLVCDTQEQAERFVALFQGNASSAAKAVNDEQKDPSACVIATTAYLRGNEVATARRSTFYFRIVRILVLGLVSENGMQNTAPQTFYSIDKLADRDA
jgi:hypothetical protein